MVCAGQASSQASSLGKEVVPILLEAVEDEDSKEGVANSLTTLSRYLEAGAGPEGTWKEAADAVSKVLQGNAMCQATNSNADEWEEEGEDEKEVTPNDGHSSPYFLPPLSSIMPADKAESHGHQESRCSPS